MSNFLKKITKRSFVILTAIMFTFSVAGCETWNRWFGGGEDHTTSPQNPDARTVGADNDASYPGRMLEDHTTSQQNQVE